MAARSTSSSSSLGYDILRSSDYFTSVLKLRNEVQHSTQLNSCEKRGNCDAMQLEAVHAEPVFLRFNYNAHTKVGSVLLEAIDGSHARFITDGQQTHADSRIKSTS